MSAETDERSDAFDGSFEGTRLRQLRRGLAMTMEERLAWLDRMVEDMRKIQGAASRVREPGDKPGDKPGDEPGDEPHRGPDR